MRLTIKITLYGERPATQDDVDWERQETKRAQDEADDRRYRYMESGGHSDY